MNNLIKFFPKNKKNHNAEDEEKSNLNPLGNLISNKRKPFSSLNELICRTDFEETNDLFEVTD